MIRFSIQTKITGLIFFIVGFSLLLAGMVIIGNFIKSHEDDLRQQSLLTARTVAELPEVQNSMEGTSQDRKAINQLVEPIRVIHKADYIVVLDMHKVRLSHPIPSLIGEISSGIDESPAFAEHTYTTRAKGEAGTVIRTFVPIINQDHQQNGVVIAGFLLPTFFEILSELGTEIILTAGLSLFFGGWGAWILASHIKKEMFELEPHEIARLLVERTETFNAMHEGVIAIDKDERITIFNQKAKEMMGISGDVIGKKITAIIPDTRLPEILYLKSPIYNKELKVLNLDILSNRIPIKIKQQTVGAVAIFQDRTEVKKLAEELTGVRAFVSALRIQNHEHMNKLHTIAGLIQLGNKDMALDYVFQIADEQEELTRFLGKNIKSDSLSGLLLSKVSRGKELGITVSIDRNSNLTSFPAPLDHHDFVIIIGNLIENAFDSLKDLDFSEKEVYISMEQNSEVLSLLVEDNGSGITSEHIPAIFEVGFSTKANDVRGIGLHLVKQIVEKANGSIDIQTEPGKGTSFIITFDMDEKRE
ncbi:ATP-binding protein [Metabacillus herbersteinensis]|uniref:histidine kinase n=1 Tax=Metabacillus herbersteinensis TaxID=283816 RepID=A0ABV6GBX5_9BACI